eukprot:CAMPEP_0114120524 /NCGR_PEP_ID=MMETSP0043_2-20121206/6693_1 /TAXON_ID=464988 /ORGANISM="Hemiselmis andersenii, Strain CCMP644" /LENGTH=133 /DNA_ID=CAMNT_0001213149 /DNA_START=43 /DNA_END=440 /DNA_ORIENTATION=+
MAHDNMKQQALTYTGVDTPARAPPCTERGVLRRPWPLGSQGVECCMSTVPPVVHRIGLSIAALVRDGIYSPVAQIRVVWCPSPVGRRQPRPAVQRRVSKHLVISAKTPQRCRLTEAYPVVAEHPAVGCICPPA